MGATEDILEWSQAKLTPWRQDALRRLASSYSLSAQDHDELLGIVKEAAGFKLAKRPPDPIPLSKTHLAAASAGPTIKIKAIRNVMNVNRLVSGATLQFALDGLTVVYGRNGSGKSGFVRILRTGCRTRCDNPAKLKVLADVYVSGHGPQQAEIVVHIEGQERVVPWASRNTASENLQQVVVFDSSAAQLYVDGGNEIKFLPLGLALPHQLNEVCLTLKARLEAERGPITDQLELATVTFEASRATSAQLFYSRLSANATDLEINEATNFGAAHAERLKELRRILTASTASAADARALARSIASLAQECRTLAAALNERKLAEYLGLKARAVEARNAAGLAASTLFSDLPLRGVGSETWRRLWLAARDFSISEAYPAREFPVLNSVVNRERCVLCQQTLSSDASERFHRFQRYIQNVVAKDAEDAEREVKDTLEQLPQLSAFRSLDWSAKLEQVSKRRPDLAQALTVFLASAEERLRIASSCLEMPEAPSFPSSLPILASPAEELNELSNALSKEATTLANADDTESRNRLFVEFGELQDRKVLFSARESLTKRRDLLRQSSIYDAALAQVQTAGITKKANELVDLHLTKIITDKYDAERGALDITNLKIKLARKSDQTKATFRTDTGTSVTRLPSDILSEGEQRALALAAFLTEVEATVGSGPVIVDDPVSSLDRDRGSRVAKRLVSEAKQRQVIVFTHDLIFFNDLCREGDEQAVAVTPVALFADATSAGRIDPAGVSWKGLNVDKRLKQIKDTFVRVKKLSETSPSEYEVALKGLYGRLRDAYERMVEEHIFCEVVRRGVDRVETQKLRMAHLSDALAVRFHNGMTKANTFSHDNPEAATVAVPEPTEFEADLKFVNDLLADLQKERTATEGRRPTMKAKKD